MTNGVFTEMAFACNEMSAQEFYHMVRYATHKTEAQKRYSEIMAAKNKAG